MSEDFPEPGNLGVKDQPGSETLTRVDRQDACVQTSMDTTEDDLIIPPAIEIPSDASNQPPKFNAKRHDELWFDDGDLVLIAGGIEFRVYKEPLLVHSPILRDMLLADGEGSATDGAHISHENDNKQPVLAILRLSDSPEDLEHFLQGFFPGRTLRYVCVIWLLVNFDVIPLEPSQSRNVSSYNSRDLCPHPAGAQVPGGTDGRG